MRIAIMVRQGARDSRRIDHHFVTVSWLCKAGGSRSIAIYGCGLCGGGRRAHLGVDGTLGILGTHFCSIGICEA
jgi:hypothetical protein